MIDYLEKSPRTRDADKPLGRTRCPVDQSRTERRL